MSHVFVNGPASWNTLVEVESLPGPVSQTIFASGYRDGLGGTSAGKAVSLAALGVDVVLRTVLGDDEPGALVRAALTHERIRLETATADRRNCMDGLERIGGRPRSVYDGSR